MNIELDPIDKKDLEALARAEGKEVGALLGELVHEAIAERKRNGEVLHEDADVIRRQQEAVEDLHKQLDALPPDGPRDGFSGRDHDKVLYGNSTPRKKGRSPKRRS